MNNSVGDILIIDDDKGITNLVKEILEGTGLFRNVIVAHDGILGTSKLLNQKFSVVIMDIKMPKKTGVDLLKEFSGDNALNPPESVIVISGFLDKDTITKAMNAGVKNFLIKPFDQAALVTKVAEVLKNRGMLQKAKR